MISNRNLRAHRIAGLEPGPRLIVTGAVHGNEVAGTRGMRRVLAEIDGGDIEIVRGSVTFVPVCNPLAYNHMRRMGERNLNRRLQPTATPQDNEDRIARVLCRWLAEHDELLRERRLRLAQMQNPAKAKALKREALDNLIRIELLWQQAKAEGLAASDEEVQRAVDDARGRFRSADAFVRRIEQSGFTEASYREHARKLLSGDRYAQRIVDREVKITEQDVQDFYELNQRLFKRSEQLTLRQIRFEVPAGASPEQRSEVRRRAEAVRKSSYVHSGHARLCIFAGVR